MIDLDPVNLVGSLYKLPLFVGVLYGSFLTVWYYAGISGVLITVILAVLFARRLIKKEESSKYGF
jgi:hypothetical protein